jgi:hypothetical protein
VTLYRIRRKSDGKLFGGLAYPWHKSGKERWTDKGTFYHEIDTISCWLKVLCGDWQEHKDSVRWGTRWSGAKLSECLDQFDRARLELYEVVVTDIEICGTKTIQATELVP